MASMEMGVCTIRIRLFFLIGFGIGVLRHLQPCMMGTDPPGCVPS